MSFRRINRSKKVPGVKLRPAAPSAPNATDGNTQVVAPWHDPGFDSDQEASHADLCPRPFKRFVLCATGIADKTSLFKKALELGAQSVNDLTDKVTHLIAMEAGSPKYRCALENRIAIMHPSWIEESHKVWLRGDDVDIDESLRIHRLPVFTGVVLCVSGIDDVNKRMEINAKVTKGGGKYVKTIERPVKVTHLICSNTNEQETEKMHYAEKFNRVGEARIHIVWEDWFWDSLKFEGRFDEEVYKVSNPRPPPKVLREPSTTPPPRSSSPPDDMDGLSSEINAQERSVVLSKDTAQPNEDEEEIASVKRVPAVTLQIWESLLKPRGFEIAQGKLIRSPSKSQSTRPPQRAQRATSPTRLPPPLTMRKVESGDPHAPASALASSSLRRANSFAPSAQARDRSTPQPFQRTSTLAGGSFRLRSVGSFQMQLEGGMDSEVPMASTSAIAGPSQLNLPEPSATGRHLFDGLRFRALGEARSASVRSAVEECGGRWTADADDDDDAVDFIVVRLVSGSNIYKQEGDERLRDKYRTECWLERCMFEERICGPDEHVSFRPLRAELPVPGADDLVISYSGLDQSEACAVRRLLRALGIALAPNFSRRSTHLLCPSATGMKAEKAREWGIPIVDMAWLGTIATAGHIPVCLSEPSGGSSCSPSPGAVLKPDSKKGKEKAADEMMVDITNGQMPPSQPTPPPGDGSETDEFESFGAPGLLLGRRPPAPDPKPRRPSPTTEPNLATTPPVEPPEPSVGATLASNPSEPPSSINMRHVPSSESPSPMRIPGRTPGPTTPSPAKLSRQPTTIVPPAVENAIISSLLGKRPSTESEAPEPQVGKRARPLGRSKSRPDSIMLSPPSRAGTPALSHASTPLPSSTRGTPAQAALSPALVPRSGGKPIAAEHSSVGDNSMLAATDEDDEVVTWVDPRQTGERNRLLYLLDGTEREPDLWALPDLREEDLVLPQAVAPVRAPPPPVKRTGSRARGRGRKNTRS